MKTQRMGHVLPGPVAVRGHEFAIEDRALHGLRVLASEWDGQLVVLVPAGDAAWPAVGNTAINPVEEPFEVQVVDRSACAVDALGLDVVSALHSPQMEFVSRSSTPVVLTSEFTMGIRSGIHNAHLSGLHAIRAQGGLLRMERGLRKQIKAARSAQFNGPAAADAYQRLTSDAITFDDHRILREDVEAAGVVQGWDGSRPLRLAFSGRLDRIKGPEYAVRLANEAHRMGLPVELHVFGVGPLEDELRALAGPAVHFRGFKQFRTQWLPTVQEEIDVMVMPHVQGDPSCTYFEALGSGAPVLGFTNETLTPLVAQSAVGWTAKKGEVPGLLAHLRSILADPTLLSRARTNGLNLLRANTFEETTRRRASHLRAMAS